MKIFFIILLSIVITISIFSFKYHIDIQNGKCPLCKYKNLKSFHLFNAYGYYCPNCHQMFYEYFDQRSKNIQKFLNILI